MGKKDWKIYNVIFIHSARTLVTSVMRWIAEYLYKINDANTKSAIVKGVCRKENFEFDIPQRAEELINGQYIICDKCPLNKEKIIWVI